MVKHAKIYLYLTLCAAILVLSASLTSGKTAASGNQTLGISVIDERNITDHLWSSDGTRIAYAKYPDGQLWGGELWVAEWNGWKLGNKRLIYTGVARDALEDWQDDWILLRIQNEPTPTVPGVSGELWKIRDDGTDLTQVTFTYTNGIRTEWWNPAYPNIGTASYGRFVPGTSLVYFSAHDGNGWWKAYTCNADGTDNWKLISGPYFSFTIAMSPTGNKFVWGTSWYWNEPTTLMASNVDGTDRVTIKAFEHKTYPLVLADGYTVIWSWSDGNIHAINIDGSNERTVIDDEYGNWWADYDPLDGQALLMTSNRAADGNWHVFRIGVDGTGIAQLTEGPYNDESPIYSPDGQCLLYRRLPFDFDKVANSQPYPYELVVKRIVMPPIPGFPLAATAIGAIASMGTLILVRRRRR